MADDGAPRVWPRYVRWLAVAYFLSPFVGMVGFVVLALVAGFQYAWYGVSVRTGVALLAAWSCPMAVGAFRWWFPRWGRRRWSPPKSPPSPSCGRSVNRLSWASSNGVNNMANDEPTPELQRYPGDAAHLAYRRAFQVWIVGFLLVICISLVMFLATWAKSVFLK